MSNQTNAQLLGNSKPMFDPPDDPIKPYPIYHRAVDYHRRGWVPVPIANRDKKPTRTEWQHRTLQTPLENFEEGNNLGIVLGEPSGGLVDIDIDCAEGLVAAPHLLPNTGLKFGRASKRNSHWVYVVDDCGDTTRLRFQGETFAEYRATGGQTVFPPSIHASGEAIEFSSDGEPARISRNELLLAVRRLAACSLLARHWKDGMRHDAVLALSGWLLRAGYDIDEVHTLIRAICAAAQDDQLSVHMRAVDSTAARISSGKAATGLPVLSTLVGEDVAGQISDWLEVRNHHASLGHNGSPPSEDDIRFTEVGNADRFVERHRDDAVYSPELKRWLLWKGGRWEEDITSQISILGEHTVTSIFGEVATIDNWNERNRMLKHAHKSCTRTGIDNMLRLAQAKLPVEVKQLDQDPWLLNCTNGVIDLRFGKLLPHDRKFWITKQIPVSYDPDARCDRFEEFLNEITNGDSSLIEFLARALGYSLTGSVKEQCFFIAYGEGANGKSTLLGLFRHLLADYAKNMPVEALIVKKKDGSASPEIVRLRGARYVTAAEAEANQKMAESLVKQLTGGDTITARGLFQAPIDFIPEFKLLLATNFKPRVSGTDPAMWRRIHLIPFTTVIPPEKRDSELLEKLKAEAPGILSWAVRGCLDWRAHGLNPPAVVTNATNAYKAEMDEVGQFLNDCVQRPAKGTVTKSDMHEAYRHWARDGGAEEVTIGVLGSRLKAHGIEERKSGSQRFWKNVQLVEPKGDGDEPGEAFPIPAQAYHSSDSQLSA